MRQKIILFLYVSIFVAVSGCAKISSLDDKDIVISLDEVSLDNNLFLINDASRDAEKENQESIDTNMELVNYTVKGNKTLMLISYELYGDPSRWKEIFTLNMDILIDTKELSNGQILTVRKPGQRFQVSPGDPYLIKYGDSLSLISKKVYGDWKEWDKIYQNNQQMIKNPNLIFYGFVLYYEPFASLASNKTPE